ncbi:hypothetical protein Dsin_004041 [Dipteronia sinensis]|uniref:Uncharacterized protein n=1 Tax=Dipteronia sinensis TaxID=43782 RepID=A0AAE0BA94_9ROSI|nr:hypothetical protein Dsin_004041 [Dipteronia sinensis]
MLATYVDGKLDLQKKRAERGRGSGVVSWTTSSDSETEEGQLMDFYGECSNVKQVPNGCKNRTHGGLKESCFENGLQRDIEAHIIVFEDIAYNFHESPRTQVDRESGKDDQERVPRRILLKHKEQEWLTISDQETRAVSLSLKSPIQLPLTDYEGDQITGKDLIVVPLVVDLGVVENRGSNIDQSSSDKVCCIFMIVCTWNVIGLGKCEKRKMVRSMVNSINLEIFFLQESKLKVFDNGVVRELRGSRLNRGIGVPAEGASGGLITLWNEEAFIAEDYITDKRCIIVSGFIEV